MKQAYYRDKKVEDCTKEELIKCIHFLLERQEQNNRWRQEDADMEKAFQDVAKVLGVQLG